MKRFISLLTLFLMVVAAWGHPDWRMHPTFDGFVGRIIDTKKYTYFTSRTQQYSATSRFNNKEFRSLFRYDKDGDELQSLSTDNVLSDNLVSAIEYSPEKGMVVVVTDNYMIDLIYDDGRTETIGDYSRAQLSYDKKVNSIFIDAPNDRIYLSTEFGYVAINEKKYEVAESRVYGTPVKGMSRIGDKLLLLSGNKLLASEISKPRLSLSDYTEVANYGDALGIMSLSDDITLVKSTKGNLHSIDKITPEGTTLRSDHVVDTYFYNMEHNPQGITGAAGNQMFQFNKDGSYKTIRFADEDKNVRAASYDLDEVWFGEARKGIWSKKLRESDGSQEWTVTREAMRPDAPAPFQATEMVWHPQRGLLVVNHGIDYNFKSDVLLDPLLLSGYKDGFWSNLSPLYINPGCVEPVGNPNGLAVDPDNPEYVYFGSLLGGMERINMSEGTDVLHMSRKSDPYRNYPGFVEIVGDQTGGKSPVPEAGTSWAATCSFAAPRFDAYGNMWTVHADLDDQNPLRLHVYCWEAADRKASVDVETFKAPKRVEIPGYITDYLQIIVPLKSSGRKNILLFSNRRWNSEIVAIDTNGTPTDTSDDRVKSLSQFVDQDGSTFDVNRIMCMWEDPNTGNVWVGHNAGVFFFNPERMFSEGGMRVNRIKVARNDGTNLADYLLDGVRVNSMASDGNGRKWFATLGAGVVCTSSDGRTVELEFNTDNSPIPSNDVFGLGYIPTGNSMMFSTGKGMAEYYIRSTSSSGDLETVRIYPNPVRPGYSGYVTIDGLPENAIVKIVDASGNIVKELRSEGGEAKWDVTNLSFNRVSSGVYFVMSSTGENGGNLSNVGKVLVIN